jgi:Putative adhesin
MGAIMDDEREMVLRMLKEGKITVEEADALLQELAEQRADEESPSPPPPPPGSPSAEIREELRTVFQDLMEAIPRDVARELKQAGEALRPGFFQVMRGLRGLTEGRAETTAEESMRPGEDLALRNAWGDVAFTVSPDDRLRMRAVKRVWTAEPDPAAAQREAEALPVEVRRHGTSIEITVRPIRPHRRARVDFELAVPAGVGARVDVSKGDVTAQGLRGKIDLRVASGDVKVRDHEGGAGLEVVSGDVQLSVIRGDVRLDVRSGDVAVRAVGGAVRGRVINGDIAVQDVGDLSLDVVHGDVAASRIAGTIHVETKSGDIALAGFRARDASARTLAGDVNLSLEELVDGRLDVETVSGDIEVTLPASARATIEAATRSGTIHSSLPLQQTTGDRRTLRGVLNAPGATIRLAAMSGDIELREHRG